MFAWLRSGSRLTKIEATLSALLAGQKTILANQEKEMAALDNLKTAVANDTTVDQSAITLLTGLKTALDAAIASNDPTQLQALSDQLGASQSALAAAVVANTPAAAPAPAAGS